MFTAEFMLRKEFVVDSLYWINLRDFNLYMQSYRGNTNWGEKINIMLSYMICLFFHDCLKTRKTKKLKLYCHT